MSTIDKIPCTPAEYSLAQQSLASLRTTLEKAIAAPNGSKLHRGVAPEDFPRGCFFLFSFWTLRSWAGYAERSPAH